MKKNCFCLHGDVLLHHMSASTSVGGKCLYIYIYVLCVCMYFVYKDVMVHRVYNVIICLK